MSSPTAYAAYNDIPNSDAPRAWCRSFEVTGNYTRLGDEPVRISPGIVCGPNDTPISNCTLLGGGYWEQSSIYNITDGDKKSREIDWTIYNTTGDSSLYFSHPTFGGTPNNTYDLLNQARDDNGSVAAYIQFTNEYRCISGILGDCPARFALTDGIPNGTYIEACAPSFKAGETVGDGFGVYDGRAGINTTNATYARTLMDNPNAQPPAGLAPSAASSFTHGTNALIALLAALGVVMATMA